MKKIGLFALFLLFSTGIFAQQDTLRQQDIEQLKEWEDTIALVSYAVINDSLPEHRFGATEKLIKTLVSALKIPNSFQYPFNRVKSVSIQYPEDSTFRVFTWQLYVDVDEYRYYGAIQMNTPELQLFPLIDRSYEISDPEQDILTNNNWYGALYYNIKQFDTPVGRKYILFGYDRVSFFNQRKLLEVLSFRNGKPEFGAPAFREVTPDQQLIVRNRLVLEYSAESSIKLNYDPVLKAIVFDHLITMGSGQQGEVFVPDGSYEGYQLVNGYWQHIPKMFDQISEEPPRPAPILDDRKGNDIFGKKGKKKNRR
jgi:hypothetical protein